VKDSTRTFKGIFSSSQNYLVIFQKNIFFLEKL